MVEMGVEKIERAFETVAQRDCRSPAQRLADQRIVGIVVTYVDPFAVGGEFALFEMADAVKSNEQPRQVDERRDFAPAQVEDLTGRLGPRRRQQEGLDTVVDVGEVAELLASPNLERLALEEQANPNAHKRLPRVLDSHPRSIRVRQPQDARRQLVDVIVQTVIKLARQLVDAVDVDGTQRMPFIDGQPFGPAVDLARAGKHNPRGRVEFPTRLENRELGAAIDLEVGERVLHRIEMARLSRQVEQKVLPGHVRAKTVGIANVGNIDADPTLQAVDIEAVATVFGHEAVDQRDRSSQVDEPPREVRADKAKSARDQDLRPRKAAKARLCGAAFIHG